MVGDARPARFFVHAERVRVTSERGKQCISVVVVVVDRVGITLYLRESLKGPKWLIPKVAQPQVPPSKKSETYYVRFCVCPHTKRIKNQVG